MARLDYGYRGGDIVVVKVADADAVGGFVYAPSTATFDVFTTKTGATQHTDLQNAAGSAITQVTPDTNGRIVFKGQDGYTGEYFLQDTASPGSTRWLVEPTDLGSRATGGGGVTAHSALTGLTTGDDHTQYLNNTRGDARYVPLSSQATTTAKGLVELGTAAELTTGTDTTRVPSLDLVRAEIDTHTHTSTDITDVNFASFMPAAFGLYILEWDGTAYPLRSTATSDPNRTVAWVGGPGPTKSGTGATGSVTGDWYVA